jgi:hypothetical protein
MQRLLERLILHRQVDIERRICWRGLELERERHAAHSRLLDLEARALRLERQHAVERLDAVAGVLDECAVHLDAPAHRQRPDRGFFLARLALARRRQHADQVHAR